MNRAALDVDPIGAEARAIGRALPWLAEAMAAGAATGGLVGSDGELDDDAALALLGAARAGGSPVGGTAAPVGENVTPLDEAAPGPSIEVPTVRPSRRIGVGTIWWGAREEAPNYQKFGTSEEQVADARRLGATFVHRVGYADPTWLNLSRREDRVEAAALPASLAGARAAVTGNALNRQRLGEFLRAAAGAGAQVLLTCISDGNPRLTDGQHDFDDYGVAEPIELTVEGYDYGSLDPHLDIREASHRRALGYLATAIGELLVEVAGDLAADGIDIHSVVRGLMLFEKIDDRNILPATDVPDGVKWIVGDPIGSAVDWARAIWRVGMALRFALSSGGLALPFYLPTVSSYLEDTLNGERTIHTRNSWSWKKVFHATFWSDTCRLFDAVAGLPGARSFAAQFAGVPYEWDHRGGGGPATPADRLGPLHIAQLLLDVEELRDVLDEAGLANGEVLVLDSGISVSDDDEYVPEWMTADSLGNDAQTRLQGWEVWRRLAGALASGANIAGWRTWMSGPGETEAKESSREYYTMGLRDDWRSTDGTDSEAAVPRPSWGAFRAFVDAAGMATRPRLEQPAIGSPGGSVADPRLAMLVFRLTTRAANGASQFVYLVTVDPVAPSGAAWRVTAEWANASREPRAVVRRECEAGAVVVTYGGEDVLGLLPQWEFTYPERRFLAPPSRRRVVPGDPPFLIIASSALNWTVEWDA